MNCPKCGLVSPDPGPVCPHCGHERKPAAPAGSTGAQSQRRRVFLLLLAAALLGLAASLVAWRSGLARNGPLDGLSSPDDAEIKASGEVADANQAPAETPQSEAIGGSGAADSPSLLDQIQPPGGYALPASYEDLGPRLLAVGGIDYGRFAQLYIQGGQPLTAFQVAVLKEGSDSQVVIDADNSYFLLNFFWAVGLANQNPLLDEGPMKQYGEQGVGRFASTGGWTVGTKPPTDLYSSASLIPLTAEQQALLETVADAIYRPCCGNPTSFPDCNHGMAMLGLLELMASQGATLDEMFMAAKYVNGFWFPQQTLEVALYFQATEGLSFAELDARRAFGAEYFSGAGFGQVHQWLAQNNLLEQMPAQGGNCGV